MTEKVNSNLGDTEEYANQAVDCDQNENGNVKEHFHVNDIVVLRWQSPKEVIERVEVLGYFKQVATLEAALGV